ncbi:hypothetical protein TSOC_010963 [Tetrabaena socialis]|uniref:Uncharacterized protein n=1 Tax=Tetrabaena socialis TaxID=47790 RepID=A0A2J7ZRW0_9CHLO|nr:hypothetical protein TSOC_010963 [Tetrabaena socialis]|eukprot:PNH03011.1 hypothetical protein TSOC_010963 [Tetrabaena socialis]
MGAKLSPRSGRRSSSFGGRPYEAPPSAAHSAATPRLRTRGVLEHMAVTERCGQLAGKLLLQLPPLLPPQLVPGEYTPAEGRQGGLAFARQVVTGWVGAGPQPHLTRKGGGQEAAAPEQCILACGPKQRHRAKLLQQQLLPASARGGTVRDHVNGQPPPGGSCLGQHRGVIRCMVLHQLRELHQCSPCDPPHGLRQLRMQRPARGVLEHMAVTERCGQLAGKLLLQLPPLLQLAPAPAAASAATQSAPEERMREQHCSVSMRSSLRPKAKSAIARRMGGVSDGIVRKERIRSAVRGLVAIVERCLKRSEHSNDILRLCGTERPA